MELFIKQFIFEPKYKLLRHGVFWVLLYIDELLSFIGLTAELEFPMITLVQLILDMAVVYGTLYILIPKYLQQKKYALFLFLAFIGIFLNAQIFLWTESFYYYYEDDHLSIYLTIFLETSSILGLAVAFKLMKNQVAEAEEREQLMSQKNKVELQTLKDQINPHFLFNVLNTIFIQTKVAPQEASDAIMKLSDMLRYQIYDAAEKDKVSISTEFEFLKNYTDLEILRRDNLNIIWEIEDELKGIMIPPFVFLPLVENAIKHSKSSNLSSEEISISLVSITDDVHFNCSNTIGDLVHESGGFGLKNLKKRLELLFRGNYSLNLDQKGSTFSAKLLIKRDELHNHR